MAAACGVVLLLGAVVLVVSDRSRPGGETNGVTSAPTSVMPSITFDGMHDFVTAYYGDLPAHPYNAWAKLDTHCQNQTGQREFLDFWATIQSVTLVSVSPRDATSVVARLKYVRRNGTSDTEDRWLRTVSVNGVMLLDESGRVGSVLPTPTTQPLRAVFASSPTRLPFTDLNLPEGIAVDTAGNLYVGDSELGSGRILKLAPGSTTPIALPFVGLGGPCALDVDNAGNIYVLDSCSNAGSRLLKLPAGSASPIELAPELRAGAKDLAVDSQGNLYLVASNRFGAWVYKLAPGSSTPTELPYTGLDSPTAIAVDGDDNVYIAGAPGRVIKLAKEAGSPIELPFTGLSDYPTGVVVDMGGTVYVADFRFDNATSTSSSKVFALASGATGSTELPFPNLGQAEGIAVDQAGVYVPSYGSTAGQKGYVLLLRRAG